MRRHVIFLSIAALTFTTLTFAQNSSPSTGTERKIANRVAPLYPDLAKRMHIRGVVRVEAIVKPNGTVKSTRALGGNPVLVDAALDAVNKWKFEASQAETTEVLQVNFDQQ
jgi:TonB family protein